MSGLRLFGGLFLILLGTILLILRSLASLKRPADMSDDTFYRTEAGRIYVERASWLLPLGICLLIITVALGLAISEWPGPSP